MAYDRSRNANKSWPLRRECVSTHVARTGVEFIAQNGGPGSGCGSAQGRRRPVAIGVAPVCLCSAEFDAALGEDLNKARGYPTLSWAKILSARRVTRLSALLSSKIVGWNTAFSNIFWAAL